MTGGRKPHNKNDKLNWEKTIYGEESLQMKFCSNQPANASPVVGFIPGCMFRMETQVPY